MSIQVKTTETASRELSCMIVPAMLMQSRRLRVAIPTHLTSSSMLIKILAILPQFEKYGKLFGNKRSVRKVLLEVFEGILRFHKRAMGFFRRSGSSLLLSIL